MIDKFELAKCFLIFGGIVILILFGYVTEEEHEAIKKLIEQMRQS